MYEHLGAELSLLYILPLSENLLISYSYLQSSPEGLTYPELSQGVRPFALLLSE